MRGVQNTEKYCSFFGLSLTLFLSSSMIALMIFVTEVPALYRINLVARACPLIELAITC
jgi:hypothetical protein